MGFHALGRAYMYTLGTICFQTHLGCWSGQFFVAGGLKAWFPFWMSASSCYWQLKPPAFLFTWPLYLQTSNVSKGESTPPLFFQLSRSWHLVPSLHGKQMGKQWKQCQTLFWGAPKITVDGGCSHEIKRRLLLGRKGPTQIAYSKAETLLCQQRSIQ